MGLVGLHSAPVGVEFIGVEGSGENTPIAVSVVSSGENADKTEDPESLIFTGFGGTTKFHDHQPSDQKLEGLNIPLEAALWKLSAVRVIRGVKDEKRTNGKIYIYDGIYFITSMWEEKGQNGFKVFKFKLVRQPDQKPAFGIWKSVQQWKNGLTTRPGLILEDLSNGAENLKVSVVNEVDEEKNGPALFTYVTSLKHAVVNIQPMVDRCTCRQGSCASRSGNCAFSEAIRVNLSLVISAKKSGNVARFMNHSCSPNVFWQPIAREQNGLWCMYIGFFAMKHIPPLTELRYDYGASPGVGQKKRCLCRSKKCCGLFG
ncbi:PREDICTED: putative inactive histone-lysine N-methyltransferase family member SUVH10 [Camelina sativa]|uniref:Inactive histone-lysine N-methyltransferase family member SUVH10 n=1 Tax=Camelina sativa TaxID=90675 RepID=A0ABM0XP34_CAMSA|nr:PREDICTED: putative inactive histone-lysine N-methyltransferase family member SUVH10 [Camelina sativa]